jgi:hypothetical protein
MRALDEATVLGPDGGEAIDPAAYNVIDGLYESFDAKIEACAAAMRDIELRAEAANEECERLYERKKSLLKHRDWLKEYVKQNMEFVGRQKVEGSLFTVRVQATAPSVQIANVDELPQQYVVAKVTASPDKAKIKDALLAGTEVPGATLVRGSTVVIR